MDPLKASTEQAERLHRFAHDVRNRLAAIQQVLAHSTSATNDPESLELMTFGEQQYFKAMREVEQLLDDLGVERGTTKVDCIPIGLYEALERAVVDLQHRFSRKQQHVILPDPVACSVMGDARCLADLLGALLSNASKFSPVGSAITVSIEQESDKAILCVHDSGAGLSEEDLRQVFVRYAWLSSRSTAGEAQGRGTLARARQWAQAMGGQLQASSPGTGQGSTFRLELPLAR